MATPESIKISEMLADIPEQSTNLAGNISDLTDIRDEFNEQINAVDVGILDVAASRLESFLEGKSLSLQNGYTYRGMWEEGQTYNTGETLVDTTSVSNVHYQCISGHTSSSDNAPASGAQSATYWVSIAYSETTHRVSLGGDYNSTNLTD